MITDFCGCFISDFSLAYRWVGLKPFGHPAIEFFNKGVGFSWRAYRGFGNGFTCVDSVMGTFTDIAGTTTPFIAFDERGITYLVATNARWLPYLADEGIRFVHYSTNRVRRQFELDQEIPNDSIVILKSTNSI